MESLRKLVKIPMSSGEISKIMCGKVKIILYSMIGSYSSVQDLVEPYNATIILYKTRKDYGHWCCTFVNNNTLYIFDSYGLPIDRELTYIPVKFRKESDQMNDYLSKLALETMDDGYTIDYNNHVLQGDGTSTCGRWCLLRLFNKDLDTDQFFKWVKSNSSLLRLTKDEFAVLMTQCWPQI